VKPTEQEIAARRERRQRLRDLLEGAKPLARFFGDMFTEAIAHLYARQPVAMHDGRAWWAKDVAELDDGMGGNRRVYVFVYSEPAERDAHATAMDVLRQVSVHETARFARELERAAASGEIDELFRH
jgi:hypothetical protein